MHAELQPQHVNATKYLEATRARCPDLPKTAGSASRTDDGQVPHASGSPNVSKPSGVTSRADDQKAAHASARAPGSSDDRKAARASAPAPGSADVRRDGATGVRRDGHVRRGAGTGVARDGPAKVAVASTMGGFRTPAPLVAAGVPSK
jgi:hypothetical protein